ncbi:MAG: tRNA uridine-5-carboxymethylaminomethyl(34) synthesis enzyme MnmG [Bacteroidaceae bacterium]|nr:tRNA uridine-5-carboxymethylaminomethyl(34) synthesis enzyme MnmG [Bacteroidaceae bacterium]MBQ9192024.1 tRNA uridine-5-carboxymethylaminomethyl(34) synthesis enzyme MnmG [Bacteroidaceae bacterium]
MELNYDVIVIGAGHAGCEAAHAAAQIGARTLLITMDMNKIAQMSCNPAVGGIAKGQIVREIDALGGAMGHVTDATSIQFRMLNRSKGPAMWSPRAQCDRAKFIWAWREVLENTPNLHIWQDQVRRLLTKDKVAIGVETYLGMTFKAKSIVLTAGTFLNGLMHIGRVQLPGGRCAEPPSLELSESISQHGLRIARMKTGTPVRIDARSVDFSLMTEQPGDTEGRRFSYYEEETSPALQTRAQRESCSLPQLPCWITYTNDAVHERLRAGLPDSPLYNGQIQSIGPRYCPSIETKLVTFPDKDQHQLFLEPEGTNTQEYYLNGFSSSLPINVQIEALRLIPAFRDLEIYRPGYAIEYDFFDPTQLHHSLESRIISGLYLAGQVNGTTGYEEAAGQGLVAGINAARHCTNQEPLVLKRDEAYIGVLIDDLVCKGVDEPYRMFTSRAEYRILLRQDNADARLTRTGFDMGLASSGRLHYFEKKEAAVQRIIDFAEGYSVKMQDVNALLEQLGTAPLTRGCKLMELLGRPQLTIDALSPALPRLREFLDKIQERRSEIVEEAEIQIKYNGYIQREVEQAEKMHRLENIRIRGRFDYSTLQSISTEGRQKLISHDPETLAQASRIPGVSPSDINVLLVLLGR